ncbi:MAG: siphovirus Gp157 family protein [SAR324 cluster bacterium]|nr:siphovirus Gp157 family protein [SAR324 cluster bacterium]
MSMSIERVLDNPAYQILKSEVLVPEETAEASENTGWDQLNLYQRSSLLREALSYLAEDSSDEEWDLAAETEEKFKEKLVGYAYVCRRYDQAAELILSEAKQLKEEINQLQERATVFSNRSERLQHRMLQVMMDHNLKKIETPLLTVSVRKKPQRVIEIPTVLNVEALEHFEPRYVRIKKELNKKNVLEDLKTGKVLVDHGLLLSEPEFGLTIK